MKERDSTLFSEDTTKRFLCMPTVKAHLFSTLETQRKKLRFSNISQILITTSVHIVLKLCSKVSEKELIFK